MIPITPRHKYHELERVTHKNGKRYYVSPEEDKLSSVTTILGATKDSKGLQEWRNWVGDKEADRIVKEAVGLGSLMHEHLENWMQGIPRPGGTNLVRKMATDMADTIINRGLVNVDEVWGIEEILYYPKLYAGTADLIGVHKGEPAIMDYKTARKMKKPEHVVDYYCQGAAYCLAHNELFGTNLRKVVLFMVTRECEYKEWVLEGEEFDAIEKQWIERLHTFYKNAK